MKQHFRNWATPLATGMFIISAVTGVLLFFHIDIGQARFVHKWQSWVLVAGAVFHTAANWSGFKRHFTHRTGIAIIGISLLVTLMTVSPFFGSDEKGKKRVTAMASMKILQESQLSTVASLIGQPPDWLQAKLEERGIRADDHGLTLREIAKMNGVEGRSVLTIILLDWSQKRKEAADHVLPQLELEN